VFINAGVVLEFRINDCYLTPQLILYTEIEKNCRKCLVDVNLLKLSIIFDKNDLVIICLDTFRKRKRKNIDKIIVEKICELETLNFK
jgi:hypothetical protein